MNVYVDSVLAKKKLKTAAEMALLGSYSVSAEMEEWIRQVIQHTHLTYKYILLNGLLAKATNVKANPLALQASAPLSGAFDARSLCHSVVVPFEKTDLGKRLGGSNEPFLNKPARFTHLSPLNAVRRGKDMQTLEQLINIFEVVNDQGDANQELIAVLHYILALESRVVSISTASREGSFSKAALINFIQALVSVSCEGETLVLSAAILFELYQKNNGNNLQVVSHPTNQSGASSKEISDIDIFDIVEKSIRYCIEVKDKNFSKSDVEHAISKVAITGHDELIFLYGPNAKIDMDLEKIANMYDKEGFILSFISIFELLKSVVSLSKIESIGYFLDLLNKHLELIRAKEATIKHCKNTIVRMGLTRDNC